MFRLDPGVRMRISKLLEDSITTCHAVKTRAVNTQAYEIQLICFLLSVLDFIHYTGGSTGGAVDKRSPPTSVTRVRFPSSPIQVGEYVVGSRLAPRIFLRILRFSSIHKNQHF